LLFILSIDLRNPVSEPGGCLDPSRENFGHRGSLWAGIDRPLTGLIDKDPQAWTLTKSASPSPNQGYGATLILRSPSRLIQWLGWDIPTSL